ncbi:xanthine phosphoribosyltransferase [Megasphaera cerevisiae DSM 20462]|jgi:xanthine phosphoribosyltransferase|uniref:Xanthine phosphoribosyltransferase n=1 Tax=Megasphaera cerevisiae DSM 20462 TaxID=1122219 RepID=A0A0J6WZH1_9FIRM|nr:xanthine phosphoribosyltransferase [Megasphaera cerevisiae]KMO87653.1 xanthine phosphoribosyltransferase [Megasphaera cerevisiae DSM 20462]OKY54633.1 xanthine phosphoribosyltransferase [Megasphaera cerevisiae]SKA23423.1 xanthine phosphoribosyltransferase [Megasphaera cerevisiae DSM 20462]
MDELKTRIQQDGIVIDNRILKVDNFLNQQIDTALITHVGQAFAGRFRDCPIDRIVTIESSGIAVAYAASIAMANIPIVFARKKKSLLTQGEQYTASIYSYTKEETYTASISKTYLPAHENILIIDDFLASGAAAMGMAQLVEQAGSTVAGIGIVIEKTFQPGRQKLEGAGYRVESLARISHFENNTPIFAE